MSEGLIFAICVIIYIIGGAITFGVFEFFAPKEKWEKECNDPEECWGGLPMAMFWPLFLFLAIILGIPYLLFIGSGKIAKNLRKKYDENRKKNISF